MIKIAKYKDVLGGDNAIYTFPKQIKKRTRCDNIKIKKICI